MQVTTKRVKSVRVLYLSGHFDESAHIQFALAIFEAELNHCKRIVLNLTNLLSIDQDAMVEILMAYDHLQKKGIRLSLVNPRVDVLSVITSVSLPSRLEIFKCEEEILGTFANS